MSVSAVDLISPIEKRLVFVSSGRLVRVSPGVWLGDGRSLPTADRRALDVGDIRPLPAGPPRPKLEDRMLVRSVRSSPPDQTPSKVSLTIPPELISTSRFSIAQNLARRVSLPSRLLRRLLQRKSPPLLLRRLLQRKSPPLPRLAMDKAR